jgi:phthalate 4,5-dioxygenase oxygenase subunit
VRDTDFGFIYGALRKPLKDPETTVYVRTTAFAFPSFVAFSLAPEVRNLEMFVPVDEEHTHFFHVEYSLTGPVDRKSFVTFMGLDPQCDIAGNGFLHISSLPNWGQDRAAMAQGRSFCGVQGINRQDIVVQESMGPIVDRTLEHLGAADRAIIHFRRLLLECARGGAAALASGMHYSGLQGREGLLPIDQDWTRLYGQDEINWRQGNASAA